MFTNNRKIVWILIISFFVLTPTVIILAKNNILNQNKMYILEGIVTDYETGKPLSDVEIKSGNLYTATTNNKGYYKLRIRTTALTYFSEIHISAEHKEYKTNTFMVELSEPSPVHFNMKMKYKLIKKDFKITHRKPSDILPLIQAQVPEVAHFSDKLGIITVYAPIETISEVYGLIHEYDTPLKKIWLQVSLISASQNGDKKLSYPEEIVKVIKQLKSLFKFTKYETISSADAMGVEGSKICFGTPQKENSACIFNVETRLDYSKGIIKLNDLHIAIFNQHQDKLSVSNSISTSINIKDGETIVLGSSRDDTQQSAEIIIVTAKVLN